MLGHHCAKYKYTLAGATGRRSTYRAIMRVMSSTKMRERADVNLSASRVLRYDSGPARYGGGTEFDQGRRQHVACSARRGGRRKQGVGVGVMCICVCVRACVRACVRVVVVGRIRPPLWQRTDDAEPDGDPEPPRGECACQTTSRSSSTGTGTGTSTTGHLMWARQRRADTLLAPTGVWRAQRARTLRAHRTRRVGHQVADDEQVGGGDAEALDDDGDVDEGGEGRHRGVGDEVERGGAGPHDVLALAEEVEADRRHGARH